MEERNVWKARVGKSTGRLGADGGNSLTQRSWLGTQIEFLLDEGMAWVDAQNGAPFPLIWCVLQHACKALSDVHGSTVDLGTALLACRRFPSLFPPQSE
eukprot:3448182-Rhodomonas_salina.1